MNQMGELFGSSTRGNVIEALALEDEPLTAYRVSKRYNMNTAKVYIEMKRLVRLGLVKQTRRRRAAEYSLADEDLFKLALRLSGRVISYDSWASDDAKRKRFRSGLEAVPRTPFGGLPREEGVKPTRLPGELENLALLGRSRFDAKYHRGVSGDYDRL